MKLKMNPRLAMTGMFAASSLFKILRHNAGEFLKIKTAIAYLKGVEVIRDLFLYQLGILICVMFLVFGVILIEGALVFFLPLQPGERATLAFIVGAVDSLGALACLAYFSSSGRWLRQAQKYSEFLNGFMDEAEEDSLTPRRKSCLRKR